ncbi:drug resistance transporter, EmrB/QacA subfamily [Nonomuraea wenchangensis]|uniref:Drug resistance transporter, EmrB/QacA subfamily n=2 Tax=Nonomuraea wenchangensis TaxID=568860 RepID=A0A1I0L420_9ACTN|nr:drug resistance transporter, EmrB/QacA subfamily [Nonomuraea wenchangensis]
MTAPEFPQNSLQMRGPLAVLCLAVFVVMVDSTIVQVMVPDLVAMAGGSLEQALWAVNGFVLVYASLLVTAGRLGGRYGPRALLLAGLALFGLASLACGLAAEPWQVIAARLAQGAGGAMIVPQSLTIIANAFPRDRRGMALGVVSTTMALAAVVGPLGGGLIVSTWGWRWAFLANVPICAVAILLVRALVPVAPPYRSSALDLVGVALVIGALAALTYALIGTAGNPAAFAVGGILTLVLFAWWERRHTHPLTPPRLFRDRAFVLAGWLGCAQFLVLSGLMLVISLHVRNVLGGSALDTALAFLPMAIAAGILSPLAGAITDRTGGRTVLTSGMLAMAAGVAGFAALAVRPAPLLVLAIPLAVVGCGVGLVMAPASAEAVSTLPPDLVPVASGVLNTGRQVAALLGVAVAGGALRAGSMLALTLLAGVAVLAAASGLLLRSRSRVLTT